MASDLLNVVMYIVYLPIIILIHELGHAVFVVLVGGKVKEVSIGRGEEAFRFGKFVLYKSDWWTGFCAWEDIDSLAEYKQLLIYMGGIIFNLATATTVWILGDAQYADWYRSFIVASYFMAVLNVLPIYYKNLNLKSDGLQCLELIKSTGGR